MLVRMAVGAPARPTDRPPTGRELNARGQVVTNRLGSQVNSGVKTKAQALGEFARESGVGDWLGTQVGRFLSSLAGTNLPWRGSDGLPRYGSARGPTNLSPNPAMAALPAVPVL